MEKFDTEALMRMIDRAGVNKLVMVNLPALGIKGNSELQEMLDCARDIYCDEIGDHVQIINECHPKDPVFTRLIALFDESEIICA